MTKYNRNRATMLTTVFDFLTENDSIISGIGAIVTFRTWLGQQVSDIWDTVTRQETNLDGITQDKRNAKQVYAATTATMAGAIRAFAKDTGNEQLFAEMNIAPSVFRTMSDANLTTKGALVNQRAVENLGELADYNITQDTVDQQEAELGVYEPLINKHRLAIGDRVEATIAIQTLVRTTVDSCNTTLDGMMFQFAQTNPAFYTEYKNARKIVDSGIRHKLNDALSGNVTSTDDEAPIKGVRVSIVELDRTVETTTLGNYRFPVVADGSYTIRFTKENFETVETTVELVKSKPAKLNTQMPYAEGLLDIPENMQTEETITPASEENNIASKAA